VPQAGVAAAAAVGTARRPLTAVPEDRERRGRAATPGGAAPAAPAVEGVTGVYLPLLDPGAARARPPIVLAFLARARRFVSLVPQRGEAFEPPHEAHALPDPPLVSLLSTENGSTAPLPVPFATEVPPAPRPRAPAPCGRAPRRRRRAPLRPAARPRDRT
jgi:hypothetical protein